jgi:alcohol dehydrogenase
MRGICFEGVAQVQMRNLADPKIESTSDCIVQVEMAGLCGSDLHPYWGREKGLDAGTVMGHEFVGRIVEVGSAVSQFKVGDRVFAPFSTSCGQCFYCTNALPSRCVSGQLFGWRTDAVGLHGGQAEYVRVPLAGGTLLKVPDGVSNELALLLGDNLSTGFYATDLADVRPQGTYVILGCGNVGLMALTACKIRGCSNVVAIDPVADRREIAEQLGAHIALPDETAITLVKKLTNGRGADGVMELVGMPAAQRLAYQLVRSGGVIATVGCHCDATFSFSPVEAYDKNLSYRTGRCPARHYMQRLIQMPEVRDLNVKSFFTHYFSLDEGPRAYEIFSKRQEAIIKGVFVNR